MKRILALILALMMCAAMVAAEAAELPVGKDSPVEITMLWWGNDNRHKLFNEVFDLYEEKFPGLTVERMYGGMVDLFTKMKTMAVSKTNPEMFGMVMMYQTDFDAMGIMESFDPWIESGKLDISKFTEGAVNAGKINGQQKMITWGDTVHCVLVNKTLVESVGMELPGNDMTLNEYYAYCEQLAAVLPEGVYATDYFSEYQLEMLVAQYGYDLISESGDELAFPKEILADYYAYVKKMQENGLGATAELTAENVGKAYADSLFGQGKLALYHTNLNQAKVIQKLMEDEIAAVRVAHSDAEGIVHKYTERIQPSAISMSTHATDAQKEIIVAIINDFVNNIEMQDMFNMEWGVPGSTEVQEYMLNQLDNTIVLDRVIANEIELYQLISGTCIQQEGRALGTPSILAEMTTQWYEVMFDRLTIEQAVDAVFDNAWTILG